MKRWIKALLSGAVIVALTVSMLGYLTRLVERKDSYIRFADFYEETKDIDVLFFGTSHVINGVFPMELWKDHGIVSYNLAGHSLTMPAIYWVFENALRYAQPKLVIVDCWDISSELKIRKVFSRLHKIFDAMPLSDVKVRAVLDLLDDEAYKAQMSAEEDPSRTPVRLLWDFSLYHDRWNELIKDDFLPEKSLEKGAESRIAVAAPGEPEESGEKLSEETLGIKYLRKLITECQQQGIDVLLTYFPFPAKESCWKEANTIDAIAEEYGVNYINFLKTEVISFSTDCYDADSHVNASGGRKITDYLGQYITKCYNIPDRRSDPKYADWDEDYKAYTKLKLDRLSAEKVTYPYNNETYTIDFKSYLMLLYDRHLSECIYLTDNSLWHGDSIYEKLLANIGIDSGSLAAGTPTLAVVDNITGRVSYLRPGERTDTGFGEVALLQTEEGKFTIHVDGVEALTLSPSADAGAVVIDNASGAVATTSQFSIADVSVGKIN